MPTLSDKFHELRSRGEKALVLFLTAGDQPLAELPAILDALVEGGADVIEVGIPFSDPFGEGPTIQASSQRSLDNGSTPAGILAALAEYRSSVPLVTMGYTNPVLRYGFRAFAAKSHESGVGATILSDLVPEESDEWCAASADAGIETIFLVAPTSTDDRIREVAKRSTGFVYVVSRTGVTGAENQVPMDVTGLIQKVRSLTDKPVCVGFGVSTPEHVRMVCEHADGAVVGSYLVNLLHHTWNGGEGRATVVEAVRALKAATRG